MLHRLCEIKQILQSLGNIIEYGTVSDTIQESGVCTTSSEASCKRMVAKLVVFLKREASCDKFLNHVNGMLKDAQVSLLDFLMDIGFKSIAIAICRLRNSKVQAKKTCKLSLRIYRHVFCVI